MLKIIKIAHPIPFQWIIRVKNIEMNIIDTEIPEVKIIEPVVFGDHRGYFFESFSQQEFDEKVCKTQFVQDNESKSKFGVLRGLHFQKAPYAQSKLVRVVQGSVLDVAVDIRRGSPTFGKYVAAELNDENKRQMFVPRGFAHGFVVLSDEVIFQYKCDNYYMAESEGGIAWDAPELAINWQIPADRIILSEKDQNRCGLNDAEYLFDYQQNLYE